MGFAMQVDAKQREFHELANDNEARNTENLQKIVDIGNKI